VVAPTGIERSAEVRAAVDHVLNTVLTEERARLAALHPASAALVDELRRRHEAGGRRVRPVFVVWGFRAGGGAAEGPATEAVVRAAAAVELLHLMALIHDDVMDGSTERRGVAASHVHLAREGSPALGRSLAILTGDVAAVLADRLLLESGFGHERLVAALAPYHEMRLAMAAGQYLDVTATRADPEVVATLKGGSYSVEGPLVVGATLAGASPEVLRALRAYAEPLGIAFQTRDDLRDGDVTSAGRSRVGTLVVAAVGALRGAPLPAAAASALEDLARTVAGP